MRHVRLVLILAAVSTAFLPSACSRRSALARSYGLGEKVALGHIVYAVYETQWVPQFGEGPTARIPQHRFFLVRLAALNSSGADLIVPNLTIEDDKGDSYPELRDGDGAPQWIGYLRQVKPADSAQGNLLFDAPPAHYKLRVTDEDGEQAAYIDIPLSFGTEAPTSELPIPGEKKQ